MVGKLIITLTRLPPYLCYNIKDKFNLSNSST